MDEIEEGSGREIAHLLVQLIKAVESLQATVSAQGITEQQMRDLTGDVETIRRLLEQG